VHGGVGQEQPAVPRLPRASWQSPGVVLKCFVFVAAPVVYDSSSSFSFAAPVVYDSSSPLLVLL